MAMDVTAESIEHKRGKAAYWIGTLLVLMVAAILAGLLHPIHIPRVKVVPEIRHLPFDAFYSLSRMFAAYVISLIFALSVGIYAAQKPSSAKIIMPILDILQSIPIVTFFPAALGVAVNLFGGGRLGFEVAAVFLIFTSMAWNMAFSVYDSVRAIPHDIIEAAESFGIRGSQRLFTITLPACVPGLLFNSILSWAAGWFALTACEILPIKNITLSGLGSFIANAQNSDQPLLMGIIGVVALLTVVVGLEFFIWRPLGVWAERFRYEMTVSTMSRDRRGLLGWYQHGFIPRLLVSHVVAPLNNAANTVIRNARGMAQSIVLPRVEVPGVPTRAWHFLLRFIGWGGAVALLLYGIYYVYKIVSRNFPPYAQDIPIYIGFSYLRILVAYLLSLAWTIPLVLWAARRPKILRAISSVAQILASLPAISLTFLVVDIFIIKLHLGKFLGVELACLFLLMNGVQWYVLFNMLGGVSKIPGDLLEACGAMGLSRWQKFRNLMLPAIMPSLLTGSLTAFGGGWNTLIFSEYISYSGQNYSRPGMGWLLDVASGLAPSKLSPGQCSALLLLSITSLIVFIVVVNRLVWKRLQHWAFEKFRLDN
jgi:NitT/TauT family transport system permease protein